MYLHIGNDIIIKKENIIAIFNLEKINKNKNFNSFIERIKEKNKVINIGEEKGKSMIIVEENKDIKVYISNISSVTLAKRNMV